MADNNKVKFGLRNVHYAIGTLQNDGTMEYGTPKAFPGAVSLSMEPSGDREVFYADDIEYYVSNGANGREGDFEVAKVIDEFHKDVFGAVTDANGVILDNVNAPTVHFALLFEFSGDASQIRHVLYNCTSGRPTIASQTKEANNTPVTETLSLSSSTIRDSVNNMDTDHAKCSPDSDAYATWYESVYLSSAGTAGD